MERLSAATNAARIREAELRGEVTAQEGAWLRLNENVQKANASRMAFLSHASGVGAIAGAAVLGFSIDQAANMERSMLNLRIATHSNVQEMLAFKDSIYQTANATAQSAPDIASIYGTIASTSGLPAKSLTPQFMSMVTKFGEIVQAKSVGTANEYTAQEAATQAIELAHQYRAYTPEQIGPFLEMLHRATYFMPGGLSKFLTQSKYFTPLMALSAGNPDAMQQSIDLGILLQQTGLGLGRGGTGVAMFEREILTGLQETRFATGKQRAALISMGLIDKHGDTPFLRTNAQNQSYFDVIGALAQVQKYADAKTSNLTGTARSHAEEEILKNVFSALKVQGSLVALVAAGGGNLQLHNVNEREKLIPSIAQDQVLHLNTFWLALQRDERGIQSLGAALGGPAITQLTPKLHAFGNALYAATLDLERHPAHASATFDGIAIGTGVLALGAAARIVLPALRFVGGGLLDIGKVGGKAASVIDDLFMRGVGKEMLGSITDLAKEAVTAAGGVERFTGALGGVLGKLNMWGVILSAFNNDAPDLKPTMLPQYTPQGMQRYMRNMKLPTSGHHVTINGGLTLHVTPGPSESTRDAVNGLLNDPRSVLYQSSGYRPHPNIPMVTTVPTDNIRLSEHGICRSTF